MIVIFGTYDTSSGRTVDPIGQVVAAARRSLISGFSFMTGSRAPASVVSLAVCLMLCLPIMRCANAQDAKVNEEQPAQTMHFELPAQPLAQALQSFGRLAMSAWPAGKSGRSELGDDGLSHGA